MAHRKFVCSCLPTRMCNLQEKNLMHHTGFVCSYLVIMTLGDLDKQGDLYLISITISNYIVCPCPPSHPPPPPKSRKKRNQPLVFFFNPGAPLQERDQEKSKDTVVRNKMAVNTPDKGQLGRFLSILNFFSIYPLYSKLLPIIEVCGSRRPQIHSAKLMVTGRST